jgi:hypothetical protein
MRAIRLTSFAAVLALATACTTTLHPMPLHPDASPAAPLPKPTPGIAQTLPGERATSEGQAHSSRKRVEGKEEPVTLIAVDHSSCTVTTDKFKDTKIGDTVSCDWSAGVVRRP